MTDGNDEGAPQAETPGESGGRIDPVERAREYLGYSRWWLVIAAAAGMAVVGPYQYVWSSIQGPLAADLALEPASLGTVFTLFVIFQAGSQFPVGVWRDRHGPRAITLLAGLLAGGGYFGLAYATSVWQVYLLYSLGAIGVGIVYTVAVNTALKWFPDRRGLTTGVGTMAFAGGSAMFVPYVRANATVDEYRIVLLTMGVIIGVVVLASGLVLRDPPTSWATPDGGTEESATRTPDRQYEWREVLRTWQFWLMYGMFVAVSGAGLMLTAKIVAFAENLQLSASVATLSATVLPLAGGVGRLVLGEVSDRVARERAMAVSFALCGLGVLAVVAFAEANRPVLFVASVVVATFFWSPQYTLFPSVVGDYYGRKHSSANYALLYSGKMWGGIFGGTVTGWLVTRLGWSTTFVVGGVFAVAAGVAALALRAPDR
jgi:OFA family oxalate/formate antiporter-like MFS transporter